MDYLWPIIGGLVLFGIISALVKAPGNALASKFGSLGNMVGKTKAEIISVVGSPNAVSGIADGGQLLQWMASGYHIAIVFDANGIFTGITHESKV